MKMKFLKLAIDDIISGFKAWRVWLLLAWQDIRLRYRRSQLGPFWITIGTGVLIYGMGFLYGKLFHADLHSYYPFLATGMIVWAMISTIILESNDGFTEAEAYIKQIKLPYTIYILRVITRNFIIFLHNILPVIPILIYFRVQISLLNYAEMIFGLFIIVVCGYIYGLILAMLGTRFRDFKQIVVSLIQLIFLLTPIMWMPKMLPESYKFAAQYNPFNQLINLVRMPATGHDTALFTIYFCLALIAGGLLMLIFLLWRARHRISFWV